MMSQDHIAPATPMGATLVASGGATFRVWAPRATAVHLNGKFHGRSYEGPIDEMRLARVGNHWMGFHLDAAEGDEYRFWVVGTANGTARSGVKRDPYARELTGEPPFPNCYCVIRSASAYPWHDARFVTPDFSEMIVYQAHVGTFAASSRYSTFLDAIEKIPHLVELGVNVLQPLPVDEVETDPSMGYNGADLFSPDAAYVVRDPGELRRHLARINDMLRAHGQTPLALADIRPGPAQLKALVDLCHLSGIAVVFDVIYNHAGGFGGDDQSLYFWDRAPSNGNANESLYFTDQDRGTGGLSFALWNDDVRQFLLNNSRFYIEELHADGLRYDEVSGLLSMNKDSGWSFCRALTDTLRFIRPRLLQNAEYWPGEFGDYPKAVQDVLTDTRSGGAGFDVVQHDGLRGAVRSAVKAASFGAASAVDIDAIARNLYPPGMDHGWRAVTCIENHDIVKVGAEPRVPWLADSSDRNGWYARSRSRVAAGVLLTAPGIPQLFMGQEFLQDQQWNWDPGVFVNRLRWEGLVPGAGYDGAMVDHLRFMRDLVALRRSRPALQGDNVHAFHVHNDNRVLAFHRWLDGAEQDLVIVATLSDSTWHDYRVGMPQPGDWVEIFNSDAYDSLSGGWPNPEVAGNQGRIVAAAIPMHGFSASASIVIPANGFVVFARS